MSRQIDPRRSFAYHVADLPPLDYTPGGRDYVLRTGVRFYSLPGGRDFENGFLKYDGRTGIIEARSGYSWDVSFPKWVFWLSATPDTRPAALAHDSEYQLSRNCVFEDIPNARAHVDGYFYNNLRAYGVSKSKAWQMYYAVRIGGAGSFYP